VIALLQQSLYLVLEVVLFALQLYLECITMIDHNMQQATRLQTG
jgi:hypothetical protein